MKVHQLRYLAALATEGSIRGAARLVGVSQATVTQGLRELEAHSQIALLARHGQGVSFTAAGQDLLAHAQLVTAQLQDAEDTLARHRDATVPQRLSLGVTPWVAQTLLARVVPIFRAELPHVQLELFDGLSALAYPRLREGSLDFVIGRIASGEIMKGLQAVPLFSYEMTVVARCDHPLREARSLAELLDADWILNYAPSERTILMDNLFTQHGIAPPMHRIHLAHSASLMLTLVHQTDMLSFCPWPLVETDALRERMVALQIKEQFRAHAVGLVRRAQETLSPAARRFVELFLEQVQVWADSDHPELRRVLRSVDVLPKRLHAGIEGLR